MSSPCRRSHTSVMPGRMSTMPATARHADSQMSLISMPNKLIQRRGKCNRPFKTAPHFLICLAETSNGSEKPTQKAKGCVVSCKDLSAVGEKGICFLSFCCWFRIKTCRSSDSSPEASALKHRRAQVAPELYRLLKLPQIAR